MALPFYGSNYIQHPWHGHSNLMYNEFNFNIRPRRNHADICGRRRMPGEAYHREDRQGIRPARDDGDRYEPRTERRVRDHHHGGKGQGQRGHRADQPCGARRHRGDAGLRRGGHGAGERREGAEPERPGLYRRQHRAAAIGAAYRAENTARRGKDKRAEETYTGRR